MRRYIIDLLDLSYSSNISLMKDKNDIAKFNLEFLRRFTNYGNLLKKYFKVIREIYPEDARDIFPEDFMEQLNCAFKIVEQGIENMEKQLCMNNNTVQNVIKSISNTFLDDFIYADEMVSKALESGWKNVTVEHLAVGESERHWEAICCGIDRMHLGSIIKAANNVISASLINYLYPEFYSGKKLGLLYSHESYGESNFLAMYNSDLNTGIKSSDDLKNKVLNYYKVALDKSITLKDSWVQCAEQLDLQESVPTLFMHRVLPLRIMENSFRQVGLQQNQVYNEIVLRSNVVPYGIVCMEQNYEYFEKNFSALREVFPELKQYLIYREGSIRRIF